MHSTITKSGTELQANTSTDSAQKSNSPMLSKAICKDIQQQITNQIVEIMERGVSEWKKTWRTAAAQGLPMNASTGNAYRGVNVLVLWAQAQKMGYTSSKWMTFKQAAELGANVKMGEKSTSGIYFEMIEKKNAVQPVETNDKFFPMAKAFNIFNLDQIENLPAHLIDAVDSEATADDQNTVINAQQFAARAGAVIKHGGSKAAYSPALDIIIMPAADDFTNAANYAATLMHELTHWTGSPQRMNREFGKRFGDDAYAVEELVAEFGAAFLGAGDYLPGTIENHASYLANWLRVLKADKSALFVASNRAQAAVDFLQSRQTVAIAA